MLIPSSTLARLGALWLASAVAVSIWPLFLLQWLGMSAALAVFVLGDGLIAVRRVSMRIERAVPGSAPLGVWLEVRLRLHNEGRMPLALDVVDHYPSGCAVDNLPRRVNATARGWVEFTYRLRPETRGDLHFGTVVLRVDSPLHLWQRQVRLGSPALLRVYPNFAALTRYALFATDHRLSQMGVLQRRRRGEGLDFDQLREYREGDAQRKIDWKASQRFARLISREYQDDRDQQVVFLIDCGRRMRAKDGEYSHFDHALDATLLLAYVGLRQGDAVGLLTMSTAGTWIPPRKSHAAIHTLLNAVYGLQPGLLTSDYEQAAIELSRRLKKRALVVIISNLRDEDDRALVPALRLLQKRHLVLFASLRERALDAAIAAPVENYEQALTHAAAVEYRRRRDAAFAQLKHGDVVCLDVPPEKLALALVNQYLEVKRSGRL
jgi:uncharacterized protein (DUF58 family)